MAKSYLHTLWDSPFKTARNQRGGFFQSMDILNVSLYIAVTKMHQKWDKPIPHIVNNIYELNQLFNMKFLYVEN